MRILPLAFLSLAGCLSSNHSASGGRLGPGRGLALVEVDSITLREPDSLAVGNLTFFATGPDGSVFLSDPAGGRVIAYDSTGGVARVFGKKGGGPGELGSAGQPEFLPSTSILAVEDPSQQRLTLFDAESGAFLRSVPAAFGGVRQVWTVLGDTAVFAIQPGNALVARWDMASDSIRVLGRLPPRLHEAGVVFHQYGRIEAVPAGGGYLALLPTEPGLQLLDSLGEFVGVVDVPSRLRRGIPEDLVERHRRLASSGKRFEYIGSLTASLALLSNGSVAVLALDMDFIPGEGGSRPHFVNLRYFLSVISADLSKACVDAELPYQSDADMPIPTFSGDTIVTLLRLIEGDNRLRTTVRKYVISTDDCDWSETGGVRPSRIK